MKDKNKVKKTDFIKKQSKKMQINYSLSLLLQFYKNY